LKWIASVYDLGQLTTMKEHEEHGHRHQIFGSGTFIPRKMVLPAREHRWRFWSFVMYIMRLGKM